MEETIANDLAFRMSLCGEGCFGVVEVLSWVVDVGGVGDSGREGLIWGVEEGSEDVAGLRGGFEGGDCWEYSHLVVGRGC